jgi:4-oxalocrotonate tautomerase
MPFINVKLIEDVFTPEQKGRIVEELTDAMVAIEGESMRQVTWALPLTSGRFVPPWEI